jgi:hypothetical protein
LVFSVSDIEILKAYIVVFGPEKGLMVSRWLTVLIPFTALHDCVFRTIPSTHSGPNPPPIPIHRIRFSPLRLRGRREEFLFASLLQGDQKE